MEKLNEHLDGAKIRQNEFASRIGVSEPFLSQLLKGTRRPSFKVMQRIASETGGAVPLEAWAADGEAA